MSRLPIFINIIIAGCLLQVAADIYAPSLPAIAQDLHVSMNLSQWSMAIYLWGVALSLLFMAPGQKA